MSRKAPTMLSTAQAAERLGLAESTVRLLCSRNEIPGAEQIGRTWVIPAAALARVPVRGRGRPKRA